MPSVTETTPAVAAIIGLVAPARRIDTGQSRHQHQDDTGETSADSRPLPPTDALAEERRRQQRGQQRLARGQQAGNRGRQPGEDRPPHPPKVAAVQQHAGDHTVHDPAALVGHGARIASTISTRISAASPNRADRKVNGLA